MLGTLVDISVGASHPLAEPDLHRAVDGAFARVARIHGLMSFHDEASDLSRLNRGAFERSVVIDADTYTVLSTALDVARRSDGAFEPCVADQLQEMGLLPWASAQRGSGCAATWRDVQLQTRYRVRFLRPLTIDLGGIAKGYAVDAALEYLLRAGVRSALVNAGGDLRVGGEWSRPIALRNPADPFQYRQALSLRDAALATSAAYFSRVCRGGREVSALIHGRHREAHLDDRSISVVASTCMIADALTKVVLFATPQRRESSLAHYQAVCVRNG